MGFDKNDGRFESVYSQKVKAGKRRTYFFDVRKTKGSDYYVTITESTRRFEDDSYTRHKIFLYKEDFNRFVDSLTDVVDHIKNELLPDYDYDEFTRRHEEREREYKANLALNANKEVTEDTVEESSIEVTEDTVEESSVEVTEDTVEENSIEVTEDTVEETEDDDDDSEVSEW